MDKKNTFLGLLFIALAFLFQMKVSLDQAKQRAEQEAQQQEAPAYVEESDAAESAPSGLPHANGSNGSTPPAEVDDNFSAIIRQTNTSQDAAEPLAQERVYSIENDFIRVDFTNLGGAVKQIVLKQFPVTLDADEPYIYNHGSPIPALAISYKDADNVREWAPDYQVVKRTDKSITFAREVEPGIRMLRAYSLREGSDGAQPYLIDHLTRVENSTAEEQTFSEIFVNVGTAPPEQADPQGWYLNFSHYDGNNAKFIKQQKFKGGGFLFSRSDPVDKVEINREIHWAAAKNQFFTGVLTPEQPGKGILSRMVELEDTAPGSNLSKGITGSIRFDFGAVPAASAEGAGARELKMQYYVGPKEYPRLANLAQRQHLVMELGWGIIGLIGKTLLTVLRGIYSFVGNYGIAIILLTLTVRGLLWPISLKAAKSAKRMQAVAEPMKEVREKYKDDPMKMNEEVMKLYKEHQINPLAGCVPMLMQFPILIALFYMLRTSSELRFAEFLWIRDLSAPEHLFRIGLVGLPFLGDSLEYFNLLPLLFGITMFFQFQTMPSTMDPTQKAIFKFMPIPITLLCYGFSSGLVMYWTISNCVSIFQQWMIGKIKEDEAKKDPAEVEVVSHPKKTAKKKTASGGSKRKRRK